MRSQIWTAICAYLMVAIAKKTLTIQKSLNEILQVVSVNIFEQVPMQQLLATTPENSQEKVGECAFQKLLPLIY